jgi:SAM-dependent methyltransferase
MAGSYDSHFTATPIGAMMRRAVWARCAARFAPGSRVLEMNCGTGEDALWLVRHGVRVLSTDVSPAMLRVAGEKMARENAVRATTGVLPDSTTTRFQQLAWEDLGTLDEPPFDGMLSNFGGLNCVQDLRAAAEALAQKLKPGAVAILCIMGPIVPWEWLWFLGRGEFHKAFRRLRKGGAQWSGIAVQYPSVGAASRAFAPSFKVLRTSAIGALLPPPYTQSVLGGHSRLIAVLDRLERRCDTVWPLPMLADHYLLELERA